MKRITSEFHNIVKNIIPLIGMILYTSLNAQVQIGQDIDGEFPQDSSARSISLSADGNVIAIGAPHNDGEGNRSGHTRVYERIDEDWVQIGEDIDGEAEGDNSGWVVNLSADGTVVAIGAEFNHGAGTDEAGHVRVYQREGDNWIQVGQDIDGEANEDRSGRYLSLSSDGNIIVIGAFKNDGNGDESGHVRVFQFNSSNSTWIQLGQDIDGEGAGDSIGEVAINAEGTVIAISAPFNNDADNEYVKIYNWDGNSEWIQAGEKIIRASSNLTFGTRLVFNAEGTRLAIGSEFANELRGLVVVYELEGESNNWVQLGQDLNGARSYSNFGSAISFNDEGSVLAIGSVTKRVNNNVFGQGRIYKLNGDSWQQIGNDINSVLDADGLGSSISISADGGIVAIGSTGNFGSRGGFVKVFAVDVVSPLGYTATLDQDIISSGNEKEVSFTVQEAELGTTCIYSFSSSGDAHLTTVSGSRTITSIDQVISGIDISDLADGTITFRMQLRDAARNIGIEVMDTVEKGETLGLDSHAIIPLKLYPNPTADIVFVNKPTKKIVIHNAIGKKVFSTTNVNTSFDVSSLVSGIYFVTSMLDNGNSEKQKLIIK